MKRVTILGGGPAGCAAARAAQIEGATACIIEKSRFPRHKVCGEFFSPEIQIELEKLRVWDAFLNAGPARIRRMKLHFGRKEKSSRLPEPAWGLSRHAFDALLARDLETGSGTPQVIATGRAAIEPRGNRLFGFKAHFEGPVDDAVELFFFQGGYVGVSAVENSYTNVCGLGPESFLRRFDFDFDRVVRESPSLAARIAPLTRRFDWLTTGPLKFAQNFSRDQDSYRAGDALSFVDPFTGSGLLAAVKTGSLAGSAAARDLPLNEYYAQCRACLKTPFEVASMFRKTVTSGWAEWLVGLVPGKLLFRLTRPAK